MANRFNQRGGWLRDSVNSRQNAPNEGMARLGGGRMQTAKERRFRNFSHADSSFEESSPEQVRSSQVESFQDEQEVEPARRQFLGFERPSHGSDELFPAFDKAEAPSFNAQVPQNSDRDYRFGMNFNEPQATEPCENYSDVDLRRPHFASDNSVPFRPHVASDNLMHSRPDFASDNSVPFFPRNPRIPLLHNPPTFADGRGRGFRGHRFQNRGGFRGRRPFVRGFGGSQRQLRHNADFSQRCRPQHLPSGFCSEPVAREFGHQSENMGLRGRGFFRGVPRNPNWRSSYPPQEAQRGLMEPPFGNVAPVNEGFRNNECEPPFSSGFSRDRFSDQSQWHHEPNDRQIQPPSWRMGPQSLNARMPNNQNFQNDECFGNRDYENEERFEDFTRDIPLRQEPGRFCVGGPPLNPNRFEMQLDDGAPLGPLNSNVQQFRSPNFNRSQQDCGPVQPVANLRRATRMHRRGAARGTEPSNLDVDSRLNLFVHRARQSLRFSAAAGGMRPPVRRLRRLNDTRGRARNTRTGPTRARRNRRQLSAGDENVPCEASFGPRQDEPGNFFLSGSPNRRPLPWNKLHNFDPDDKDEDELPPPEENWDALPPAPPFVFKVINYNTSFMIANAAPKRKKKPVADDVDVPIFIEDRLPLPKPPAEVIDVVDDGANLDTSDPDVKICKVEKKEVNHSVVDLASPRKGRQSPNTHFLIELSMSSEENSMSCEILSDFQSQFSGRDPSFGETSRGDCQAVDLDDSRDENSPPKGALAEHECHDLASEGDEYNDAFLEGGEDQDDVMDDEEYNEDALLSDGYRDDAPEGEDYHDIDAQDGEEYHDDTREGEQYYDDDALDGEDYHDDALAEEYHDDALAEEEYHDDALAEEEYHDDAPEGEEYHDDDAQDGEEHNDDVLEEEESCEEVHQRVEEPYIDLEEEFHNDNFEWGGQFQVNSGNQFRYFEGIARGANGDDSDKQQPSGDDLQQGEEDSDMESVHELDLVNIHPEPDCPEDFLEIDESPGALPIPTGDQQANRPDPTRRRVYNGPAPSGLTAPPSPNAVRWMPGNPRRRRPLRNRNSSFVKRSHLIKMHHQSAGYDILHQEFPDDCNSDRLTIAQ